MTELRSQRVRALVTSSNEDFAEPSLFVNNNSTYPITLLSIVCPPRGRLLRTCSTFPEQNSLFGIYMEIRTKRDDETLVSQAASSAGSE